MSKKSKLGILFVAIVTGVFALSIPSGNVGDPGTTPAGENRVPPRPNPLTIADVAMRSSASGTVVSLDLGIDDGVCCPYTEFYITWNEMDSLLVNGHLLADLLIAADSNSVLLCDCAHDGSETYKSIIMYVEQLDGEPGLKIALRQKVYLRWTDISENLRKALEPSKAAIFYGNDYKVI
ncbi:MAG: hypothetical protein PHY34_06135 [Patescibacteria group bacterium]|nr:hypothetical protein [Patescibacteria group bacterium]MDD5715775.1 hypothetical protein [Patescibacteria group bacterium]